jgi:hypothetical protein
MQRPLSARVVEGLGTREQIELGLVAAKLALPFWLRANPEKPCQGPLIDALEAVATYCATGKLVPKAKEIAELAYRTVSSCDLPSGEAQRSSGFSVAHIAMAPWLYTAGSSSKAQHNAMVAINYSDAIHSWAGKLGELEAALLYRQQELLDA